MFFKNFLKFFHLSKSKEENKQFTKWKMMSNNNNPYFIYAMQLSFFIIHFSIPFFHVMRMIASHKTLFFSSLHFFAAILLVGYLKFQCVIIFSSLFLLPFSKLHFLSAGLCFVFAAIWVWDYLKNNDVQQMFASSAKITNLIHYSHFPRFKFSYFFFQFSTSFFTSWWCVLNCSTFVNIFLGFLSLLSCQLVSIFFIAKLSCMWIKIG